MVEGWIPKSLNEALYIRHNYDCNIVAGGTDMLVKHKQPAGVKIGFRSSILYLSHISELDSIQIKDKYLCIGAITPLEKILHHPNTPNLLKKVIREMASPAIRHTATLPGNIANASPAGDSLVALYLLDAVVKIQSVKQTRFCLVSDFILDVKKCDIKSDEIISEVRIPIQSFSKEYYVKVAPRKSDAISKVSFAGTVTLKGNVISDLRIAIGAVGRTVVRNREIEKKYIGLDRLKLKLMLSNILGDYRDEIRPIDDQRSTKIYRKKVAKNLIKDFINSI